jgi:hypothetical protein
MELFNNQSNFTKEFPFSSVCFEREKTTVMFWTLSYVKDHRKNEQTIENNSKNSKTPMRNIQTSIADE